MLFYTWMKRKYGLDATDKGELARSMKSDSNCFPKQGSHNKILKYLECRKASDCYIAIFEECWEEYIKCGKKR